MTSHPPPILTPSSDPHGRNSIISATEIISYETSKRFFLDNLPMRDDWRTHLAAGCTAGFAATVLGSPADVLGTKAMQKHGRYAGLTATQIARKMVRRHQFRAHLIRKRKRSESWRLTFFLRPPTSPTPAEERRGSVVLQRILVGSAALEASVAPLLTLLYLPHLSGSGPTFAGSGASISPCGSSSRRSSRASLAKRPPMERSSPLLPLVRLILVLRLRNSNDNMQKRFGT